MIHDVDESLKLLLAEHSSTNADVAVVFEAPTKDWAARRNGPTIDVYLYDVREDLQRRSEGLIDVRDEEGRVTERRKPPRFFKLSYLVTAWTTRPEDEHRLLSSVLMGTSRYERLPEHVLTGQLVDSSYPVAVTIGLPPVEDRAISDVWSALGGELKPSLDLVVTVAMDTQQIAAAGPPVLEPLHLAAGALAEKSDFHTKRGGRRSAKTRETTPDPIQETVIGGADDQPGRTLRMRMIHERGDG
jgi:hypothetical protein